MKSATSRGAAFLALLLLALPAPALSQDFADVEIRTTRVADGVYMLMGQGGNLGLLVGEDGAFLIDDQYAPLTDKIRAAVAEVSPEPVRFVLNTHWHGDHTGGNENFGEAGALIVAHENVRERLSMDQVLQLTGQPAQEVPAAPDVALPVVTFTEDVSFHLNGEDVRVFHVENAHTDGDAVIHFVDSNVVHMGDAFFNGMYPFVDLRTGGSIDGMIAASGKALAVMDADTQVIPGHGALSDREGLRRYRDMLQTIRGRIADLMEQGRTLEEVQAARPTRNFDTDWGGGFIAPEAFVATVHSSLQGG